MPNMIQAALDRNWEEFHHLDSYVYQFGWGYLTKEEQARHSQLGDEIEELYLSR